jgi:signal transduction histidine kinase
MAVLPDGSVHWIAGRWQVLMNESGEPARMIGANIDVTERNRAEEALLEVNRRLIEAQEEERARIGRELHDDINQRLAMLAIELERLQDNPSEVWTGLRELRKQTSEISNDVQALSHDLYSSKLEYLGAVGGMKSWCNEFGERQGIQIEVKTVVRKNPGVVRKNSLRRILARRNIVTFLSHNERTLKSPQSLLREFC